MRKYIIEYIDNTISPLQLFLPKMAGYLKIFLKMVLEKCLFLLLLIMNF